MTLAEYYGFPEGTNVILTYSSFYDTVDNFPCPPNMKNAFYQQQRTVLKEIDVSNVTDMYAMFGYCQNLVSIIGIENWDTSNVTDMNAMFNGCSSLTSFDVPNWDTSQVTNMQDMFYNCSGLTSLDLSSWDTSKVTNMNGMFNNTKAVSFNSINCGGLTQSNKYPLQYFSDNKNLIYLGGFLNAKMSWDNSYGLAKLPNLTYESCINVLNGLYDFSGNSQAPNSSQGKLKVHKNFLDLVGDKISIGTNKGWTISS